MIDHDWSDIKIFNNLVCTCLEHGNVEITKVLLDMSKFTIDKNTLVMGIETAVKTNNYDMLAYYLSINLLCTTLETISNYC